MSGRGKRVFIYTVALLVAPMPVMPFERGTLEFAFSLIPCGLILAIASFYVAAGELRVSPRGLLGNKLLASSVITCLFGAAISVGAIVYLSRS